MIPPDSTHDVDLIGPESVPAPEVAALGCPGSRVQWSRLPPAPLHIVPVHDPDQIPVSSDYIALGSDAKCAELLIDAPRSGAGSTPAADRRWMPRR